jgi:P-type Ca2+ transporter type 2C
LLVLSDGHPAHRQKRRTRTQADPQQRDGKITATLSQIDLQVIIPPGESCVQELAARDLVPGDIVLLEAGNLVPADGRILESAHLRLQEAALTGESAPIDKVADALDEIELPLGDRRNIAFMGMAVTYGCGQLVVTATGMHTQLGAIAALIQTIDAASSPVESRSNNL